MTERKKKLCCLKKIAKLFDNWEDFLEDFPIRLHVPDFAIAVDSTEFYLKERKKNISLYQETFWVFFFLRFILKFFIAFCLLHQIFPFEYTN